MYAVHKRRPFIKDVCKMSALRGLSQCGHFADVFYERPLTMSLKKTLNDILVPKSLPVVVAQSDKRHAKRPAL